MSASGQAGASAAMVRQRKRGLWLNKASVRIMFWARLAQRKSVQVSFCRFLLFCVQLTVHWIGVLGASANELVTWRARNVKQLSKTGFHLNSPSPWHCLKFWLKIVSHPSINSFRTGSVVVEPKYGGKRSSKQIYSNNKFSMEKFIVKIFIISNLFGCQVSWKSKPAETLRRKLVFLKSGGKANIKPD